MKKVKYLTEGDKIKNRGVVLTVIERPTPMGRASIYQVKCLELDGSSASFVAHGNLKIEIL